MNSTTLSCKKYVYEKLGKFFYVDDCVTSVDSYSDFEFFQKETTSLLSKAKFDLRKWRCTGVPHKGRTSMLGLVWDPKSDTLSLSDPFLLSDTEKITKRVVLSHVQKVFDPLEFVCPVLLKSKLLLQRLWDRSIDWDTEIDPRLQKLNVFEKDGLMQSR